MLGESFYNRKESDPLEMEPTLSYNFIWLRGFSFPGEMAILKKSITHSCQLGFLDWPLDSQTTWLIYGSIPLDNQEKPAYILTFINLKT